MYLRTLSDHLLDIGQNAVHAAAKQIRLTIRESPAVFRFTIIDDGKGMDASTLNNIFDPFYTTRDHKIRKVGLGLPFLRDAAEHTGGSLAIQSKPGEGTTVDVTFRLDHIDCQPVGDLGGVLFSLITYSPQTDWIIDRMWGETSYSIDTCALKPILGSHDSWQSPQTLQWLKESIEELEESVRLEG